MYVCRYLVASFLVLSALSSPVKRSAGVVENDLKIMDGKTMRLENLIVAFPVIGGTIGGALGIGNAALNLDNVIQASTIHLLFDPFSVPEANEILTLVKALVHDVQETLKDLDVKVSSFESLLGVPNILSDDLVALQQDFESYFTTLEAACPSNLVSEFQAQAQLVDAAFSDAINMLP